MSDTSICPFSRTRTFIVMNPDTGFISNLPEAGKKMFHVELTSEEWSSLSIGEFYDRMLKARLAGASFLDISGEEPSQFSRFLLQYLPVFREAMPIRMTLDGGKGSFIDKIVPFISGACVDINMPLKESYSREEKEFFKGSEDKVHTSQYRDQMLKIIESVDNLPLTYYRINSSHMMGGDGIEATIAFLSEFKAPIAIPNWKK